MRTDVGKSFFTRPLMLPSFLPSSYLRSNSGRRFFFPPSVIKRSLSVWLNKHDICPTFP